MIYINKIFPVANRTDVLKMGGGSAVLLLLVLFPTHPEVTRSIYQPTLINLTVLFVVFYLLFRKTTNLWSVIQTVFVFALFSIPLLYKWQFAHYDGEIVGGLLPWSDASAYYSQANRLLLGYPFTVWGGRRPLFAGLLSVLLKITDGDFMASLVFLTLINASVVAMASQSVSRYYRAGGGAAFVVIAYQFYSRYAGKTLTEQLGFALGNLALYFLLYGVYAKKYSHTLVGIGILSLALNVRAGAMFILPVLILWIGWNFRKNISYKKSVLIAVVIVVLAFLTNFTFARLITGQNGTTFSNYSYVLYGLASGNKGWTHVYVDYPGISETEIMPLAINKIKENPKLFVEGIIGSYNDYFDLYLGAFSFIFAVSDKNLINNILWGLVLVGLLFPLLSKSIGTTSFVPASFLGVFASLALLPPLDADAMRAFAATIPFTALWVAAGVSGLSWLWRTYILRRIGHVQLDFDTEDPVRHNFAGYFSVILVLLMIPGPLLVKAFSNYPIIKTEGLSSPICNTDYSALEAVVLDRTGIVLINNNDAAESYMPYIRIDDFRNPIRNSSYPFLEKELIALEPGDQLSFGTARLGSDNDLIDVWLITDHSLEQGGFIGCARETSNEWLKNYRFYYLRDITDTPVSLTVSQSQPIVLFYFRLFYGIVFYFVLAILVVDFFDGSKYGARRFFYNLVVIFLITQPIFVWSYVRGIISPSFAVERIVLDPQSMVQEQGYSYILPLGTDWMSQSKLGISPATVYEDGIPLKYPNALHQEIRDVGEGRYSVWDGSLYLSTSDNTDPRTNHRKYEIEWNSPVAPFFEWLSYLAGGGGIGYIILMSLRDNNIIKFVIRRSSALNSLVKKNVSKMKLFPTRHLLYGCGGLLLLAMGYYFHPSDVFWYKLNVEKDQVTHDEAGGFSYVAYMGYKPFSADEYKESNAILLEDGKNLGPSNALVDRVSRNGSGRFMFFDGYLYFSTSDNTDPRENDREYTLALPLRIPFVWHVSLYIVVVYTAAFGLVWREKHES